MTRGRMLIVLVLLIASGATPALAERMVVSLSNNRVAVTSSFVGENLVLFKGSRHPQEAWTFMKFLVSEPVQELMAGTGLIPSIKGFDREKLRPEFRVYLDQLSRADPRPPVPQWDRVDEVFSRMVTRILVGEKPAAEAMKESAAEIDGILAGP